ncbi:sugar transferase [Flavobacterium psychraquaticum]|uniref:sugar transferase n=1 Tax=Flavobacterium psychraquaticum TaxID=3103958 RepID=UPI002ACE757E|nr:sugar transferase [Flavobacterium sp. LB-N7T]
MTLKRLFDLFLAVVVLLLFSWLLLLALVFASIDTRSVGLFLQKRIGKEGRPFLIYKIKTLNDSSQQVSAFGRLLRKSKIDELPQLFNILNGTMSFVGPRPDIPGYADQLTGAAQIILSVQPGVTGLASLKYRNEEQLLAVQENPLHYNDTVIWPDKVRLNSWYVHHQSFLLDLKILFYTFFPFPFDADRVVGKL